MRHPDLIIDGQTHVWHVPIENVYAWVNQHPDLIPRDYGDERAFNFARVWRDLWYVRAYVSGGDYDDEIAESFWFAVSLRDLRHAPDSWPRLYKEAEWEVCCEELQRHHPPLDGHGLQEQLDQPPTFLYQFHGLNEQHVMNVGTDAKGRPESFAVFGWQALARGRRPVEDVCTMLSYVVNSLRVREGLEPLAVSTGREEPLTGFLCTLEDGSPITPAVPA